MVNTMKLEKYCIGSFQSDSGFVACNNILLSLVSIIPFIMVFYKKMIGHDTVSFFSPLRNSGPVL